MLLRAKLRVMQLRIAEQGGGVMGGKQSALNPEDTGSMFVKKTWVINHHENLRNHRNILQDKQTNRSSLDYGRLVPRLRKNQLTCVVGAQIPSNTASDHRTESHHLGDQYNFNHTTYHKCYN